MLDLAIARLQYEILNIPLSQIATEATGDSSLVTALKQTAKDNNWIRWWPEPDLIIDEEAETDGEDALQYQSEAFIERSKKRMTVFQLAKDFMLAQRYVKLEKCLVDAAINTVETFADQEIPNEQGLKNMSALYKDLVSKSITQSLTSLQISSDDPGMPTVVYRDLSASS